MIKNGYPRGTFTEGEGGNAQDGQPEAGTLVPAPWVLAARLQRNHNLFEPQFLYL